MLGKRRKPGTHMVRELATGAKAELLPVEVIRRFRDALDSVTDDRNTQGDR